MNFNSWKDLKKVKEQDLVFLGALKKDSQTALFAKVADQMAAFSPSFSEGLAFLEIATDLILMGHLESLFEESSTFGSWQIQLKKLRYPMTHQRDDEIKAKLEKLPWPSGSKVKFERRGDKSGVEFKVFISNPSDLTKILASLERVQVEMKL